jgi:signal transduction histidine kinase
MTQTLKNDLADVRHGDHICLPYDSVDDRVRVMAPFIGEGLARGERCLYVLEPEQNQALLSGLAAAGVNAGRAIARGALQLRTPQETYFRSGSFDPDDTLALLEELITTAQADGFTGLRGSGEMTVTHATSIPWSTILSYEARVNEWFGKRPFVALCRYHRPSFAPTIIHDVLRTHPVAIVSDRVCRNLYYEKPDVALASDGEAARVDWMLRQLRWSRRTELRLQEMTRSLADETALLAADNQSHRRVDQELERAVRVRDRFLELLARELSLPVAALTNHLRGTTGQRGDDGAVGRHLQRLGALVEELRAVSRLTNRQTPLELDDGDLTDVVRQALLGYRDLLDAAGCALSFQAEARVQGSWDRRRVGQLMANLLSNAAARGPRQPVGVELGADADSATLAVRYRGLPLPPDEEDQLFEHLGGPDAPRAPLGAFGLWNAREIAGALGGTFRVAQPAAGETTLTVVLPRSPRRQRRRT